MGNQAGQWNRNVPAALMCAVLSAAAGQSQAQTAAAEPDPGSEQPIPEVVVTAQRTESLASKTPVSMTVLSGAQLLDAGADNPATLGARLPNVHLDGSYDGLRITMRGVSNNDTTSKGDPSAAFMLDGIYIARPQNQNVSFFDLARIEVLRGPQGTLYGRNTTAGVVNVISNKPSQVFEGAFTGAVGNYNSGNATAMLNVPVSEALALRAALAYNKHDSYLINGQGTGFELGQDRDDRAARLSARLALGKRGSLLLRYDHARINNKHDSIVPVTNFYTLDAAGNPTWKSGSTDARLTNGFVPRNAPLEDGFGKASTAGLGAELDWDLGPLTFHYLGSRRRFEQDFKVNYYYGVTPAVAIGVRYRFEGEYAQDSHELRFATKGNGALAAQAGLYYFREESSQLASFRDLQVLGLTPYYVFPHDPTISRGTAVFGQATYKLSARLRATAGARYSDDDKLRVGSTNFQQGPTFNPATDLRLLNKASLNTHKATWRLGAEFDLSPSTLLFGTLSTGYKAGGFNDGCLAGSSTDGIGCPEAVAVPASALVYQPETIKAIEAGLKTRFWNNQASLSATAFSYDYTNLQLSGVAIVRGAPRFVTTNAGVAKVRGMEVEGQLRLIPAGRLSYSLALLDAEYVQYSPNGVVSWAGRTLDRAPRTSVSLGYDHTFRFDNASVKAGIFSRYSSDYSISVPSQLLEYQVPSRTQSDLNFAYLPGQSNWSAHAYVRNLEDKVRPITIDSFRMVVPSDPRTYGARLEYRF